MVAALIVASSLGLVIARVLPGYESRPLRQIDDDDEGSVLSNLSVRLRLSVLVIITLANQFAFSIVFSIFPRYASGLSLIPLQIGALFSAYAAVRMIFFLTSHRVAIVGVVRLLTVSTVMMIAAQLMIGEFTVFPAFVLAFIFLGASSGLYIPTVINAFALSRRSASGMTATMGVYEGVSAAGNIAGPLAGGAVADFISPSAPYIVSTGVTLMSLPIVLLSKGRSLRGRSQLKKKKDETNRRVS